MARTDLWPLKRGIQVWLDGIRFGTDFPETL